MKLPSGKRIGQSGYELALAVFFSFFLHGATVVAALFLYMAVAPRVFIPPHYEVKLVGLPAEVAPIPAAAPAPAAPVPAPEPPPSPKKPQPKTRKTASRRASAKAAVKKGALPELSQKPSKPAPPEQPQQGPATTEQPSTPPVQGKTAGKTEGVAVTTPQQDFKYSYYLNTVREKISRNWRPPPDAPDATARVVFSINRSGWVGEVNLDAEHSNGTFGFKQAAIRAIRSSNPFPPLPEDFAKQTLEFSVDLMAEN